MVDQLENSCAQPQEIGLCQMERKLNRRDLAKTIEIVVDLTCEEASALYGFSLDCGKGERSPRLKKSHCRLKLRTRLFANLGFAAVESPF